MFNVQSLLRYVCWMLGVLHTVYSIHVPWSSHLLLSSIIQFYTWNQFMNWTQCITDCICYNLTNYERIGRIFVDRTMDREKYKISYGSLLCVSTTSLQWSVSLRYRWICLMLSVFLRFSFCNVLSKFSSWNVLLPINSNWYSEWLRNVSRSFPPMLWRLHKNRHYSIYYELHIANVFGFYYEFHI